MDIKINQWVRVYDHIDTLTYIIGKLVSGKGHIIDEGEIELEFFNDWAEDYIIKDNLIDLLKIGDIIYYDHDYMALSELTLKSDNDIRFLKIKTSLKNFKIHAIELQENRIIQKVGYSARNI